jgi:GNAT superfamily N-acetyltransferase
MHTFRLAGNGTMLRFPLLSLLRTNAMRIVTFCFNRFNQHSADAAPPQYPNVQPDTLHEWLTIHMDRDAMIRLAKPNTSFSASSSEEKTSVNAIIQRCCLEENDVDKLSSKLRLRLATELDLKTVERLVKGLAIFERYPDAVHVTQDHYRRDGFPNLEEASPLFYCLLLEDPNSYACGIAFVYIAHSLSLGKFLYLEDLFIEEEFRGLGGGKAAMVALARVCQALDCERFVWQALDWNTPALNFYANIGGNVQQGLLTSRFAGEMLNEFCRKRSL